MHKLTHMLEFAILSQDLYTTQKHENMKQTLLVLAPVTQRPFSLKQNFFQQWEHSKTWRRSRLSALECTQLYCLTLKCYLLDKHYIEIAKEHTRPLQEWAFFFSPPLISFYVISLKKDFQTRATVGKMRPQKKHSRWGFSRPSILLFWIFPTSNAWPPVCSDVMSVLVTSQTATGKISATNLT
jgi:hypothetical protein